MIPCNCVVQDAQVSAASEAVLRQNLNAFTEKHFGEPAEISWLRVPAGSGFTAGSPSTSAIISIRANAPVSKAQREPLLRDLCAMWMAETNQTLNEVVGVISDPLPEEES
ncbi:MAG: hypothetical protein AAGL11_12420 [Pseudomonadota bacterium]